MGGDTTPNQAVPRVAGGAFRMKSKSLLLELQCGGPFQLTMLRYTPGVYLPNLTDRRGAAALMPGI
jgi:hypothetical protein